MFDAPPPGFSGLNPDVPVTMHRRHLPHWRQAGASYFVTFRLADSLPAAKLAELSNAREQWLRMHPYPSDDEFEAHAREQMEKTEKWLDQGHGACVLRQSAAADAVETCLRHFEGERYILFSAVVMPNHVHACLKPLHEWGLGDVLKGWKSVSSRTINRTLGRDGQLWQEESFDRIVRDCGHLRRVIRYIESNPEKAGVSARCWTISLWDEWLGRGAEVRVER